jgi:diadenosine tetraphosphate (Ap4A) HIT family hydrolase
VPIPANPASTLIHERVALCRDGANPTLICPMPSGWAVLGDQQFLEGYSLLLPDPVVECLNDLDTHARARFLVDMSLLGDAVAACTSAYRINYEILGNAEPALHAHVWPRRRDEPEELRRAPVACYPKETRNSVRFSPEVHGAIQVALRASLEGLLGTDDRTPRDP